MITSFENPNYHLNDDDDINSNIPAPLSPGETLSALCPGGPFVPLISGTTPLSSSSTQYYQSDHLYQNILNSKRRKNYANLDLYTMGIDLDRTMVIQTPLSECFIYSRRSDNSIFRSDLCDDVDVDTSETSEDSPESADDLAPEPRRSSFMNCHSQLHLSTSSELPERSSSSPDQHHMLETEPEPSTSRHVTSLSATTEAHLRKCTSSPDSNDSGIQSDVQSTPSSPPVSCTTTSPKSLSTSQLNHYQQTSPSVRTPVTCTGPTISCNSDESYTHLTTINTETESKEVHRRSLPPGWECHEDEDGSYYWHVKSGTIQREIPTRTPRPVSVTNDLSFASATSLLTSPISSVPNTPKGYISMTDPDISTHTSYPDHISEFESHAFKYASGSLKVLYPATNDGDVSLTSDESIEKTVRFAVRSLGCLQIAEEDITPERSSKAVNRCIMNLSLGRNDFNDMVGRWGDGKYLFMYLDEQNVTLLDPCGTRILNIQQIQLISVWGVGRDNGRDFAYVARDRVTRQHMCHVFQSDIPARHIANTLRDICRKLMSESSQRLVMKEHGAGDYTTRGSSRPTNLPNLEKASEPNGQKITFQSMYNRTSFPTPMEEPKKVLRAHYLGSVPVARPGGVELLNMATEEVYGKTPNSKWQFVNVAVAPSTITLSETSKPDIEILECRVRFLSFMGIAMGNTKLCSFIMHTAADSFVAHVFHCEPSAGNMCKTIEAACKLRYQKCLDAHHPTRSDNTTKVQEKGIRSSLKKVLGSMSRTNACTDIGTHQTKT